MIRPTKKALIALLLFMPMLARAASFTDGTFAYSINNDKQTVTVVANTTAYSGDLVIPGTVTNDGETYQVTEIGASAFKNCTRLSSIQMPEGLTIINNSAFEGCTGLESIKIPNSVETIYYAAFKGCRLLEKVELATGLKVIGGNNEGSTGSGAFENCTALTSIIIPGSVTTIHASAFRGCTALERVSLLEGLETMGSSCFSNCSSLVAITIPSTVTSLGANAFVGCRALESAELGGGLQKMGNAVFKSCQALEHLTIADGVTVISAEAFQDCTGLTELSIPGSVETIYYTAFKGCRALEKVSFGQGVQVIGGNNEGSTGSGAFENCISLTSINIPGSVSTIHASAFRGCTSLENVSLNKGLLYIGSNSFQNCSSLESIIIPTTVSHLGANAFVGCSSLKSAVLGKGITEMGSQVFKGCASLSQLTIEKGCAVISSGAFQDCSSLTKITVPGSVTTISYLAFKDCNSLTSVIMEKGVLVIGGNNNGSTGSGAFENCTALEEVVVPSSITTIYASAFRNCSSLKRFTIQATVLPEIGTNVFQNASVSEATLYVPEKSIEKYRETEPWSTFGTIKTVEEGTQQTVYPSSSYELSDDGKTLLKWNGTETEIDFGIDPVLAKVTAIGYRAFFRNEHVEKLTLNEGITSIEDNAFHGLSKLTTVNLPASLTSMGSYNFTACESLKDISVAEGNTVYSASDGVLFMKEGDGLQIVMCGGAKTGQYVFPDNVKSVGENGFYFCDGITSVVVNEGLERIEDQGFYDCDNLKEITLPEGFVSIGDYAFTDCINLDNVQLPSTVKTIGAGAFYRCKAIKSVTCLGTVPPEARSDAFGLSSISQAVLYVPVQCVDVYRQTEPWDQFGTIEGIGTDPTPDFVLGDANGDGKVTVADYIAIAHHIMGNTPEGFNEKAADANGDGKINVADYVAVAHMIMNEK